MKLWPACLSAAQPVFVLLGLALPIDFLMTLESYLHYLRPGELLPTFATAWIFLAAPLLPVWVLIAGLIAASNAHPRARTFRALLLMVVTSATAAAILASLISGALAWFRAAGWLVTAQFSHYMVYFSVLIGALAAPTSLGRAAIKRFVAGATVVSVLGSLTLVTIPFYGWKSASAALPNPLSSSAPPAIDRAFDRGPGTDLRPAADVGTSHDGNAGPRPHILLLTMDALSADHMSLYGYGRQTTPMLSEFARGATVFAAAYANANLTTTGVASILTGTRPWTHRALQLPSWPLGAARAESLPALLKAQGYQTASVATNPYAAVGRNGFGPYFEFAARDRVRGWWGLCSATFSSMLRYACAAAQVPVLLELQNWTGLLQPDDENVFRDPSLATRSALAWLRSADRSRPIFLWVHLFPPHSPYAAPSPWIGTFDGSDEDRLSSNSTPEWGYRTARLSSRQVSTLEARYDESVLYVDDYAGRFLQAALKLLGRNTVVVVTADHGESFGHDYGGHTGPGLFDDIIHVPLIIKFPNQTHRVDSAVPAEQVDIAPTLAELAGIAIPPSWEGRSLTCALPEPGVACSGPWGPVFSMNFEQSYRYGTLKNGSVAAIDGNWKLIHYMGTLRYPFMPRVHDELYDLSVDRAELRDVAAAHPSEVRKLRASINAELAAHGNAPAG
ncbi:MAG TPA: sulfatase-like hydrolase/transferase [Steroidobacteraceae bacterium]|nr:sulfatase-like hydrolase/transferase [Steroidobacteraceae bacterium]